MAEVGESPRELNNSMTGVLLAYVRRVGGDGTLAAVLERAGEATPLAELEDPTNWSSYEATLRRFQAAADVLGDPDIGRRAGIDLFRHYASSEVIALVRSLGSPAVALEAIAETANKQSTVVTMNCVESHDTTALVSAVSLVPTGRDKLFCDYTAGVLEAIPTVFGFDDGVVEEIECQRAGHGRCLYRVTWDPATSVDAEARAQFLAGQVDALTHRFEALERLATELASIGDIDVALQTVTDRAGVAVWAPQFLLVVRLPREQFPRVHSVGLTPEQAARCAEEILAPDPDDHGGARLIVDVASADATFGRLVALYPEGQRFLPEERRLLAAYAGHAAAVLATAAALAEARERAETIGALFDLATALSEVGTVDEVADRLARALPPVVDCERASVFVFEPRDAVLVCRGQSEADPYDDGPEGRRRGIRLDRSLLTRLTRHPEPVRFGHHPALDLSDNGTWSELGAAVGCSFGVVMPIVARHSLLGLVVAGSGRWSLGAPDEGLRDRLLGVAGIAATALDNARLLDQIRHQAGHDGLTGLPNARLLDELAEAAIATARRHGYGIGVLFVDLDLFKAVNDELGHHAGDALLVEVGARLRTAVRAGDTVARLGGDEFGVLLPHVVDLADAEAVAERIIAVLDAPLLGLEGQAHVSASVGVAVSADASETFDALVRRADRAMYEAKATGRARYRVAH
ncbi:MAG TPA: diguanylate cyclase [Acidimicrobiales bacterium]|nr:diguanylate cyclase [Acidimicrobiales bacterium]